MESHNYCWPGKSPGEGNGNPLQYSCLENPMDGGAWWAIVHGVAKSWTLLSDFTSLHFLCQSGCKLFNSFNPQKEESQTQLSDFTFTWPELAVKEWSRFC